MERLAKQFAIDVRPDELPIVRSLMLFGFFLGLVYVFIQMPALALFLETYGASNLPYLYVTVAIFSSLTSLSLLIIGDRASLLRQLQAGLVFILLGTVVFWYGIDSAHWWLVVFLLPVWFEVVTTIGGTSFFTLVNQVFDVRQGRRLFGIVRLSLWIGNIVGGLAIPTLVGLIQARNLMILSALCAIVALVILISIGSHQQIVSVRRQQLISSRKSSMFIRDNYIRSIVMVALLWWVAFYFVDNVFITYLEGVFDNADQIASFLGVFYGVIQGTVLVMGNFLTGAMLQRFSLLVGGMLMPVLVLMLMLLLAALQAANSALIILFLAASAVKLVNGGLGFSVDANMRNLLYQPLPSDVRARSQTIIQGIVEPLAKGVGGAALLYLVFEQNVSVGGRTALFIGIAAIWLPITYFTFAQYPRALQRAIEKRRFGLNQIDFGARTGRKILREALQNDYPEAVLHAMKLLDAHNITIDDRIYTDTLDHRNPIVREYGVEQIGTTKRVTLLNDVIKLTKTDTSDAVREKALTILPALITEGNRRRVAAVLQNNLGADTRQVRRGAIIGLLSHDVVQPRVLRYIAEHAESELYHDRIFAAEVIGGVGDLTLTRFIRPLLQDENFDVRRAAIVAAGKLNNERLWPDIIQSLAHPELKFAASTALVGAESRALPFISEALSEPGQTRQLIIELLRTTGRIGGDKAIEVLLDYLDHPNPHIRTHAINSLGLCDYVAPENQRLKYQIRDEVEQLYQLLVIQQDLQLETDLSLLQDALVYQFEEGQRRVLTLLACATGHAELRRLSEVLNSPFQQERAYAVELLETEVPSELRTYAMPALDVVLDEQRLAQLEPLFDYSSRRPAQRIQQLIVGLEAGTDTWVQVCALYAIRQLEDHSLVKLVRATAQTPDALVRETALWTLSSLDPDAFERIATEQEKELLMSSYSTVEKVLILTTVPIFAETPSEILADVASIVDETVAQEGEAIITKGDLGDSMYVIVSGSVRVHDDELTLNTLGEREVFGELALLDPEPRIATVTALEETILFRIDQQPFYDLISDRGEVARGVMRVLVRYLRNSVRDLRELQNKLTDPAHQPPK